MKSYLSDIAVPVADSCAFCDYLAGKRSYTVLERGHLVAVLVTREQRGLSHVLVIPIAHRETILDLQDNESTELILTIRKVSWAIEKVTKSSGIAIWQNNGTPANQTIPHVHFHVAGTLPEGGTNRGDVPELEIKETEAIARKLKTHMHHNKMSRSNTR